MGEAYPDIGGIYGLETMPRLWPHRAEDEEIRGPVSAPGEDAGRPFLVLELVEGPTAGSSPRASR